MLNHKEETDRSTSHWDTQISNYKWFLSSFGETSIDLEKETYRRKTGHKTGPLMVVESEGLKFMHRAVDSLRWHEDISKSGTRRRVFHGGMSFRRGSPE